MKTGIILAGAFLLACAIVIFSQNRSNRPDDKRAARIEAFLADVCMTSAGNVGTDYAEQRKNAQECGYGNHSRAKDLAASSDAQLIDHLVTYCVSHGGIANVDHIKQKFDAIYGKVTTDADLCRDAIRTAFPEF